MVPLKSKPNPLNPEGTLPVRPPSLRIILLANLIVNIFIGVEPHQSDRVNLILKYILKI